jgi:MinD superfamily P-loop ATPase
VTQIRKRARSLAGEKGIDTILVDGPPGIGCPVIASITGASYVVLVTEPSHSAILDLKRVLELIRFFNIPCGMVINKYDINPDNSHLIEELADREKVKVLARIPHSFCIMDKISSRCVPFDFCPELRSEIESIYDTINTLIQKKENPT